MANEIKDKFGTSTALTITLASLGNNSARQSTIVDNTTARYQDVLVYVKIKLGTSPTGNTAVNVYVIRDDNDATTPHRSDGAGSSDASMTILNARPIGALRTKSSPATGDVLYGEFVVSRPGPKWGIAVENKTGVALDATGSNHWARYVGLNAEVQ